MSEDETLNALAMRLYREADAELAKRVRESLEPIARYVAELDPIDINGTMVSARSILDRLADAMIASRRERNRAEFVARFVRRVREWEGSR